MSSKDMQDLQTIKDALFGEINVDKHRKNILEHKLVGVVGYPDTSIIEVDKTINNLRKYNTQIDNVRSWVPHIDPDYFEKKRQSMLPEVRQEKQAVNSEVPLKIIPLTYVPRDIMRGQQPITVRDTSPNAELSQREESQL